MSEFDPSRLHTDLCAALALATRSVDGIAGHALRGRFPHIGDDVNPWRVRGWLLPHVMDLLPPETGIGRGRWAYWLRCIADGRLPDEPLPRVEFRCHEDASRTAAGKMLAKCVSIIEEMGGRWRSEATSQLIDWLAFALHVSAEEPRLPDELQERLYRHGGFCLDPMLEEPADYFGWLLSECKGRGKDPAGFYPTPMSLVLTMAATTFPEGEDCRRMTVCDPCVGTGRMLLVASNWSMRLSGQDIDRRCVLATLINGALYAPWLAFPLPDGMFNVPEEDHAAAAVGAFDQAGQGLLFPD